jgi:hypothetical protein
MNEDFRDLKPLDASEDPLRFDRLVRRITAAAAPELARRRLLPGPLLLLTEWTRPTLAAAAMVLLLAGSALFGPLRPGGTEPESIAIGVGVPFPVEVWLETGQAPPIDELVYGIEGVIR